MNMHSRIIQLETEPVPENERLSSWEIESDHWFLYTVADYVAEDEDHAHSLAWFKEILSPGAPHIDYFTDEKGEGLILREGFFQAYFSAEYTEFVDALRKLSESASPDAFANDSLSLPMYNLNAAYDDKYGFYIQNDDTGLCTLNRFLRQARMDTPYYIGGTVDYHC